MDKDELNYAGEKILIYLYKPRSTASTLDQLRVESFKERVTNSKQVVDGKQLPPTSDSAKYHFYRVYYQVQEWLGNLTLDLCDWGWKTQGEIYVPVTLGKPVAPDELINIIHCGCKYDCSTQHCSCVKHGIKCGMGCSNCDELNCSNCESMEL